jgi:hypothetical protein
MAEGNRAVSADRMEGLGQSYNQLMSLLGTQAQTQGAVTQSAALKQAGDLKSSRRGKVYALAAQLRDQAKADKAEASQTAFMNAIAKSKLGVYQDSESATAIKALADARKAIVDSKRPTVVKGKRK